MERTRRGGVIAAATCVAWVTCALIAAAPAVAQGASSGWTGQVGVGVAAGLAEPGDHADRGPAFLLGARVLRWSGDARALGVTWEGTWFDGRYGTERRHHVGVDLIQRVSRRWRVEVGAGVGLATSVDADLPEPGDPPGGGVVAIGDEGTVDARIALGLRVPLGHRWLASPATSLLVQRGPSGTFVTSAVAMRFTLRRGGGS